MNLRALAFALAGLGTTLTLLFAGALLLYSTVESMELLSAQSAAAAAAGFRSFTLALGLAQLVAGILALIGLVLARRRVLPGGVLLLIASILGILVVFWLPFPSWLFLIGPVFLLVAGALLLQQSRHAA